MTRVPIHFDPPPRVCPRCMTNNPRTITRELWDPGDEERGFPRELMRTWGETVCGTCHPDPRSRKVYVDGVDPDNQRSSF